jgi:choice-of-anchor B domain-containing protein
MELKTGIIACKKLFLACGVFTGLLWLGLSGGAQGQISDKIQYLSRYDDLSTPPADDKYNDVWGWSDGAGREYAIFGSRNHTYFVDVTNPLNPILIHKEPGRAQDVTWRDFKTYQHYAYAVNDGAPGSLQIFDLQGLPNYVTKVYDHDSLFESAHNIFIEGGRLYTAGAAKAGVGFTLGIFDIATDPTAPRVLNYFNFSPADHSHDVYVRNDTAYCSNGFEGYFIFDLRNPVAPVLIGSLTSYPAQGFNHSSWLTDNGQFAIFADEVPMGLPLKIADLSDLSNIFVVDTFRSNLRATPHNPFVKGDFVFISYYEDGLQVFNISDPQNIYRAGYFDTYPNNVGYAGYRGCWGTYPYLPSGIVLASDRNYGLYVLDVTEILGTGPNSLSEGYKARIIPNPARDEFSILTNQEIYGEVFIQVFSASGQTLSEERVNVGAGTTGISYRLRPEMPDGLLLLKMTHSGGSFFAKVLKIE